MRKACTSCRRFLFSLGIDEHIYLIHVEVRSRWIRSRDIFFIFREFRVEKKKNEDVSSCVSKICKIGIRASEQDIKIELYLLTTMFGHLLSLV